MLLSELTQVLMKGLVEDGGGILESLWQPGPGQLSVNSLFWVGPFKGKKILASGRQGKAEESVF